jgi:hypothetical protein
MIPHSSYKKLLQDIPRIEGGFEVSFLTVPTEKFLIVKFIKIFSSNFPLLVVTAGCHGDEPAPVLAIFKNYKLFLKAAKKSRVNLIFYPLVNPSGFDKNIRLNRKGFNCNRDWIHKTNKAVAEEIKVITKDIKKYAPSIFASIHEDDETKKEFYIFSFGDKKYENPLIEVGERYFPILQDGKYGDIKVKNGVVCNHHDGSAEDFMSHSGCKFSCCTETPSLQSLPKRIKCNTDLILKLIELTKKAK